MSARLGQANERVREAYAVSRRGLQEDTGEM
jgi:hypothetical protein